jgi:hypothetical protein
MREINRIQRKLYKMARLEPEERPLEAEQEAVYFK